VSPSEPYPKDVQLARGERRYRRKVASPKQWQAIVAAKHGPCRCSPLPPPWCVFPIQFHHLVSREDGGDDVPDNIVPICGQHHEHVHHRRAVSVRLLLASLSDAEYAYMIERGGEDYPERAYGIEYQR